MITPGQIRKIHALKNRLGWDDDAYRVFIIDNSDVFATSSKHLTQEEAERIIRKMEEIAIILGVWHRPERKRKYEELAGRPYMATPKQMRMIEAMWSEVSKYRDEEERQRALRAFLRRIVGVDDLRFLERWQVSKVVRALESMKKQIK